MSYYNQPYWTTGQSQADTKSATKLKNGASDIKMATNTKNGTSQWKIDMLISKLAQANFKNGTSDIKMVQPIQKWHKRSFYQGPGVKFPFSWEKITLPPLAAMAFSHAKTTPLKLDFFRREKIF